ncbi:MAG: AAA family ATPase, partial [Elusimicrobiota bacterium]
MHRRRVLALLKDRLKAFPAVALIGPRQAGKTTLAQSLSPRYFDLEDPGDRLRLDVRWEEAVAAAAKPTVLDEAQTWPEVFPRLRSEIDRHPRRNGRFLLLGSVSPALMRQVSESLAGRLSLVELTPFLSAEMSPARDDDLWLKGGFPRGGILGGRTFPQWQRDYLAILAQRDLPNWGLPAKPAMTERLFRMTAALPGQA